MKTGIACFVLIMVLCLFSSAQNQQPPAFVMLEDVLITADDPRFTPLFDTLTGNGKGSLISALFEPVLTGKTYAVSDIDEKMFLTKDEVKNLLYDKQRFQDEWGNELDTVVLKDEDRYTLKNLIAFRLYYLTCYDKDMKLISRSFIGLLPMNCEKDADNEVKGWRRTIYFSAKTPEIQNVLAKECSLCVDKNMSYLTFLNQIPVDELSHEAHFISFEKANFFSGNFPYKIPATPESAIPSAISADAKLIEKEFVLNNDDYLFTPVYENNFFKLNNGPQKIQLNFNTDISDIPMFFGYYQYGYLDMVKAIMKSVENGNDIFSADAAGSVFIEQISLTEAINKLAVIDTIISLDPYTGNQIATTYRSEFEITALKILELHDGKSAYPVAVCLEQIVYDEDGISLGTKPFFLIPINKQLITELDSNQAYLPEYPQQLTLWGYLLSGMYKGEIVSERPIDNAEWQRMREFLK